MQSHQQSLFLQHHPRQLQLRQLAWLLTGQLAVGQWQEAKALRGKGQEGAKPRLVLEGKQQLQLKLPLPGGKVRPLPAVRW